MSDANEAALDWPLEDGRPGREVWYGIVATRDASAAFWYRFTLLSTAGGHREARLWAALTTREGASPFASQRWELDELDVQADPFALGFGEAQLTSGSARGEISGPPEAEWVLAYEPDAFTFTPLRSRRLTDLLARFAGTGRHWSRNQSVSVDGRARVGATEVTFEQAPGHQGHTVGALPPETWTWVHCNAFDEADEDVSLEALDVDGRLSVCLRRGERVHEVNRLKHVLFSNETQANEPGHWRFTAAGDGIELAATIKAPGRWQRVAYCAGDETLRYNAHCSLATARLTYDPDDGRKRALESDRARVEWGNVEPPIEGDYEPDWKRELGRGPDA